MKRILSLLVALSMVASIATVAFAADEETDSSASDYDGTNATTSDTVDATNPQGTEDTDVETDGRVSTGAATVDSTSTVTGTDADGNNTYDYDFYYTNDDDGLSGVNDTEAGDITVWAQVLVEGAVVYKLDIEWGAMKFQYTNDAVTWDPDAHDYVPVVDSSSTDVPTWTTEGYVDGTNNKLTIINHSNAAVEAEVDFALTSNSAGSANAFNAFETDGTLNSAAVQGNFYTSNDAAVEAAGVLGIILPATLDEDEYNEYVKTYDDAAAVLAGGDSITEAATPVTFTYTMGYLDTSTGNNSSGAATTGDSEFLPDGTSDTNYDEADEVVYYTGTAYKDAETVYIAVDLSEYYAIEDIDGYAEAYGTDGDGTGWEDFVAAYPYADTLFFTASMVDEGDDYDTLQLHNASGYTDIKDAVANVGTEEVPVYSWAGSTYAWPTEGDETSDAFRELLVKYGFASELYFAFSGTPDTDADLSEMSSVGTITVTVSTYTDADFEYDATVDGALTDGAEGTYNSTATTEAG